MNNSGPRVESGKSQGLFSKKFRPNRYLQISTVGFRSGGLDLMGSGSNGLDLRASVQKLKGWSAGAISKELRGLCVKNRDLTGINFE